MSPRLPHFEKTFTHTVDFPRHRVAEWFARPGAVTRLTPGLIPMSPQSEASSLADGTTVFSLPVGTKWVAQHQRSGFRPEEQFVDAVANQPFEALTGWRHTHRLADAIGSTGSSQKTALIDTVSTKLPIPRLRSMFSYRATKVAGDLAAVDRLASYLGHDPEPLTVAVTGATGTVGTQLRALLMTAGHTVVSLVRHPELQRPAGNDGDGGARFWDTSQPADDLLEGIDAVVHLAGAPIAGHFNDKHLEKVRHSRVEPTRALAELIARSDNVKVAVGASAVGFYGADRGTQVLDESAEIGPEAAAYDGSAASDNLAAIVRDWEAAWEPAREAGTRVVNVRTGLVLAGGGGLLPLLAGVVFTGLGGPLGDGTQWFPWIALDDLLDIYHRALVDPTLTGPINATAPLASAVDNAEFTKVLGTVLRRPTVIPVPTFGPALLLGERGAKELALANQKVDAQALSQAGHTFRFTSLQQALEHELLRES